MDIKKIDEIKINFIVGPGRSGTTLLVVLLNQDPECVAVPEIKHFLYFYKKYKNITHITQQLIDDYREYLSVLNQSLNNPFYEDNANVFLGRIKVGDVLNYSQLTKLFYLSFLKGKNDISTITCIVDKNPFYTFHIKSILNVFPDAKFVAMIRDYRAYVLSNRQDQKTFKGVRSVFYYAFAWNHHAKKLIELIKEHGDKVLPVRYEDLVDQKEMYVERIMKHFGLNFSPAVFDFHIRIKAHMEELAAADPNCERTLKKIADLSKPVNLDRVYAWKAKLSIADTKKAEFVSSEYGKAFGYEPISRIDFAERTQFMLNSIPGFLRVGIFFAINSVRIHHFLNVVRKANYKRKAKKS